MKIRKLIHDKPWLLVVAGLTLFVTKGIVFLIVALQNAPEIVR